MDIGIGRYGRRPYVLFLVLESGFFVGRFIWVLFMIQVFWFDWL